MEALKRDWTVLVYTMAEEALLAHCAWQTLKDIALATEQMAAGEAGASPVKVVAQVSYRRRATHPIRRFDFEQRSGTTRLIERETGLQYVPRRDAGPRRNLAEFLRWGQRTYPAQRYCVVLQGHAWGADYTVPNMVLAQVRVADKGANRTNRGRAHKEAKSSGQFRLILGSPRSRDHLSNRDLQQVLSRSAVQGRFSLLGMDSCLMSMAEILYQLHGCAEFSVAPEGLGPIRGWPFHPILMWLHRHPGAEPAALGRVAIEAYARRFKDWGGKVKLTISLCSLAYAARLMEAMQALVAALRAGLNSAVARRAIIKARKQCIFLRIPTYIDLFTFCRMLRGQAGIDPASSIGSACAAVEQVIQNGFVQKVGLKRGRHDLHGLSIYFPDWRVGGAQRESKYIRTAWTNAMATPRTYAEAAAKIDAAYCDHEFADRSGWKSFLLEFLRARAVA